ncbi:hypothetical protein DFH27DRAFT_610140 [Peziza echinospora]|nr:hypothetical protein DFH27DRAFT_610140 [Peziza echinospora]
MTTRCSVILSGVAPEPALVYPLDQVNTYTLAVLNRCYPSLIHVYRLPWYRYNGTFFGRRDPVTGTWSSHNVPVTQPPDYYEDMDATDPPSADDSLDTPPDKQIPSTLSSASLSSCNLLPHTSLPTLTRKRIRPTDNEATAIERPVAETV